MILLIKKNIRILYTKSLHLSNCNNNFKLLGASKPKPVSTALAKVVHETEAPHNPKPSTSKCTNTDSTSCLMPLPVTPATLASGEHVVAVWYNEDRNELQWYLGIVSKRAVAKYPTDKILISYLYRSGQSSIWKFPESAQETETPFRNIIYYSFPVRYECISVIKCIINKIELEKIEAVFKEYLKQVNEDTS